MATSGEARFKRFMYFNLQSLYKTSICFQFSLYETFPKNKLYYTQWITEAERDSCPRKISRKREGGEDAPFLSSRGRAASLTP